MFTQAINSARKRIWIASPYFVPDRQILGALKLAVRLARLRLSLKAAWLPYWLSGKLSKESWSGEPGIKVELTIRAQSTTPPGWPCRSNSWKCCP